MRLSEVGEANLGVARCNRAEPLNRCYTFALGTSPRVQRDRAEGEGVKFWAQIVFYISKVLFNL